MPRLLIVDDEEDVLDVLSEVFAEYGYEVDTASSGAEAIEKVRDSRPHVMLLDVRMPGMDGLETLRRVKEIDPKLGVIMVTAVTEEAVAKEAMEHGAFDFITKPIDLDQLRSSTVVKMIQMLGSEDVEKGEQGGGGGDAEEEK